MLLASGGFIKTPKRRDWPERVGVVLCRPWNNPPQGYIVAWTKSNGKRVALSFFGGRFAIVFDIEWYLSWMGARN